MLFEVFFLSFLNQIFILNICVFGYYLKPTIMKKKYFLLKVLFLVFSSTLFAQNPVPTIEYQALVDFYN